VARRPGGRVLFPLKRRQAERRILRLGPDFFEVSAVVVEDVGDEHLCRSKLSGVNGQQRKLLSEDSARCALSGRYANLSGRCPEKSAARLPPRTARVGL